MSLVSDIYERGQYSDTRDTTNPTRQTIVYDRKRGKWTIAPSYLNEPVTLRSNLVRQVTTDTRVRRERLARHERTARGQR